MLMGTPSLTNRTCWERQGVRLGSTCCRSSCTCARSGPGHYLHHPCDSSLEGTWQLDHKPGTALCSLAAVLTRVVPNSDTVHAQQCAHTGVVAIKWFPQLIRKLCGLHAAPVQTTVGGRQSEGLRTHVVARAALARPFTTLSKNFTTCLKCSLATSCGSHTALWE